MTLFAVVPVKDLAGTKSRLAPVLDEEGRASLTLHTLQNVLSVLEGAGVQHVCVVSPDEKVLDAAASAGAEPLKQSSRGLNPALEEARRWAVERGATSLLVLPADLPLLESEDVEKLLKGGLEGEGPLAVVCPDAAGAGTNALLLRPPDALPFLFGPDSFQAHLDAAGKRGVPAQTPELPRLAFDLDTAEDLTRLEEARPGETCAEEPEEGLRILPIHGVPEVRPGDDLAATIHTSTSGRIKSGDVVVVTHKIVSKAEGRLVDLATVEPSALAKDFAARYGKDARQVEVVLRESKRIVRMDRGVIISETRHGFVCANAGVDASNVPGDETVCLLPLDPDASARSLRDGLRASLGVENLAIIISDSFGRPWRFGITDVAIGISGMRPLADYRGTHDPHGKPLNASVLAVADELASAAEMVMGKTDGVPVAVVRGYPYERGEGSAEDLILDPSRDLFR